MFKHLVKFKNEEKSSSNNICFDDGSYYRVCCSFIRYRTAYIKTSKLQIGLDSIACCSQGITCR